MVTGIMFNLRHHLLHGFPIGRLIPPFYSTRRNSEELQWRAALADHFAMPP
jgi:hypothetical protein